MERAGRQSVAIGKSSGTRLAFGSAKEPVLTEAQKKKMEQDEIDEKYGLPETWARHTQTRTKQDNCNVCEAPFSMVAAFGMGQRDFYCKQCGFAVCKDCSMNKKRLSIKDEEKFRVCDLCDTNLENARLKTNFEKLITLKTEKVALTSKLLERLREQKTKL
jgi:hypothetical protein